MECDFYLMTPPTHETIEGGVSFDSVFDDWCLFGASGAVDRLDGLARLGVDHDFGGFRLRRPFLRGRFRVGSGVAARKLHIISAKQIFAV